MKPTTQERLASAKNKMEMLKRLMDQPAIVLDHRLVELQGQHDKLHLEADEFVKRMNSQDNLLHDELETIEIITHSRMSGVSGVEMIESARRAMERVERELKDEELGGPGHVPNEAAVKLLELILGRPVVRRR